MHRSSLVEFLQSTRKVPSSSRNMNGWFAVCGCTGTGDEKHSLLEASAILGSSANLVPLVCHLFFPLSSLLSSWSLLFPLAIAFHTILSSCQGNESESSVSQPPHFSFVSFGLSLPLSTHSLVCNLLPPLPSHDVIRQEQWLLGNDLRSNELCPASNSACRKLFIFAFEESASLV